MRTVPERITVRERIAPEITASLFANYRSSTDAVMELVDNALDSRLPRRPMRVELTMHPSSILVLSQGGEGMGPRDLERRYLRWGASPKRGKNLLGQYGQGGKAAIGHLGSRFTVEASRPNDTVAWRFADHNYRDRSRLKTYELETVARRSDADMGYVRIRIDGVDKRVDIRRLGQRLGETYRPLLESPALAIMLNGSPVPSAALTALERRPFRVRANGAFLTGWFGIADLEQQTPDFVPGLRCYKLGRLITHGEYFGHAGPARSPGMARLIGEVEIGHVQLTMNKSDFDRDSAAWIAVEARLHRLLGPLARRLAREDAPPPPASALKVAEQARRLLSQALRFADRGELFPGVAAARHKAPAKRQEMPADEREAALLAPRAAGKPPTADEPRRRGFGDIVIRHLDPRVRSQTIFEGDVKQVVINARYPLYVERRGDIWYQLETAVWEICKSIEGASVAEYERRVNEVLLVAFQLRQRRRKGRMRSSQLRLVP